MKIKTIADLKLIEVVAKKLTTFLEDEEFAVSVALEFCPGDGFKMRKFLEKLEELDGVKCDYVEEMCDNPMCYGSMHSGYVSCESLNGSIHMLVACGTPVWKTLKFARI